MWISKKNYEWLKERVNRAEKELSDFKRRVTNPSGSMNIWRDEYGGLVITVTQEQLQNIVGNAVEKRLSEFGLNEEGKQVLWYQKKSRWAQVFGVACDVNGYPQFIIYDDGQWRRISAKHFRPAPNTKV